MTAPPVFETFGCRLNLYETEAMKALAAEGGVGDVVVVNTCAVTAEAVRQARQRIRRLRRERPGARLVVTGCAAQTEPDTFAAMPEVDLVLGNGEKMRPESWTPDFIGRAEGVIVDDIMSVARDRRPPDRRLRQPRPRLCAGAERLRPPLHLLHHPLRPRPVPLRPGRRGGRADRPACRRGLRRDRADRRRPHQLGRRPARQTAPRRPRAAHPAPRPRSGAPAPLVHRQRRGRRRAGRRHGRRSRG
jgi:hypothetical protein